MALTTRAIPRFSHNQSLPPGSKNYNPTPSRKPVSHKANQNHHTDNSLVVLKDAIKPPEGHPRLNSSWWRVLRKLSTGEGDGKPLQYSCLENPMNSMKKQKKI